MAGTKVEFVPGFNLFFTNLGQKKLYELLGVSTHKQFTQFLNKSEGLSNEDLEKMILAGLFWEKKAITLEEVQNLIEYKFYIEMEKNFEDLNEVIITAFANSGLMDKKRVEALKKAKDKTPEELEKEVLEMLARKPDTGEVSKT